MKKLRAFRTLAGFAILAGGFLLGLAPCTAIAGAAGRQAGMNMSEPAKPAGKVTKIDSKKICMVTNRAYDKDQIPVEVITDSMAAHFMAKKGVDMVVVGADRIARNGDAANKIGTYGLACIAAAHDVPFFVAAPWSTVDLGCRSGDAIPIEERPERELSHFALADGTSVQIVPDGVPVRNPSFDVTPHALITAIVTERGVVQPVSEGELAKLATQ